MLPSYHATDEYRDEHMVREEQEDQLNKEAEIEHERLQAQADREARAANNRGNEKVNSDSSKSSSSSSSSSSPENSMASRGPIPEPPLATLVQNSQSPSKDGANELYKFDEPMNIAQSSPNQDMQSQGASSFSDRSADVIDQTPTLSANVENSRGLNLD